MATTKKNELTPTPEQDMNSLDLAFNALSGAFTRADNEESGIDDLKVYVKVPFAKFFHKSHNGYKSGDLVLHYGSDEPEVINLKATPLVGVQILNIAYQRVAFEGQWSKAAAETNKPFCRSYDGKVGAEGGRYAGQACATCPAANWDLARETDGPTGVPPCRENIVLLISVPGHESPFHLTVKGINIKPFNEFGGVFKKHVDKLRTYAFAFNLTLYSKLIEHANGENDIFMFSSTKEKPFVDVEQFEKAKEVLEWYREDYLSMMRSASMAHDIDAANGEEAGEAEGSAATPF